MDSDRLSRWLTLGANIAVLAGIALLIVELKQNRDMMRAQTRHDLSMGIVGLLTGPAENEQLSGVMYRINSGEDATPQELFQFEMRTNALFRYWENVHYQHRIGLYDDIEFARQKEAWKASMAASNPGVSYWCRVRPFYSPEFAAEMDSLLIAGSCQLEKVTMNLDELTEFATRYAGAWSGQDPESFAAFYADYGSLRINDGEPSVGRAAIEQTARGFMTGFPDMVVRLVKIEQDGRHVNFHWHWTGTNTGPGGTGNAVDLTGYEEWTIGENGLILESLGHLDDDEYQRQLAANQPAKK